VNEKQLFRVSLRIMGVFVALSGGRALWLGFTTWVLQAETALTGNPGFPPMFGRMDLVYGLLVVVLGFTMIRWPEWIERLAWPTEPESSN